MSRIIKKSFPLVALSMFCVLFSGSFASAETALSFSWTPNAVEENIAGYILFFGETSREEENFIAYDEAVDVGNVDEYTIIVPMDNVDYFFCVAAYDNYGVRGALSQELRLSDHKSFSISATAGQGGSVSPNGVSEINFGGSALFQISPDNGYEIADVTVDGASIGPVSEYSFDKVVGDHSLEVKFSYSSYLIQTSANSGGTISPNGQIAVDHGEAITIQLTPNAGFVVNDVMVDGISIGAAKSYTLANISEDHVVEATFKEVIVNSGEYSITLMREGQGSIINLKDMKASLSADADASTMDIPVKEGGDGYFWIKPAANWELADVLVDGESIGTLSRYKFSAVSSNHSFKAVFKALTKKVEVFVSNGKGTVDPSGSVIVAQGENQTFNIIPASGYKVGSIKVDGRFQAPTTQYTLPNILTDHIIDVSFNVADGVIPDDNADGGVVDNGATDTEPNLDDSMDSDGDGISDLAELEIGSDPSVANIDKALLPVRFQPVSGATVTTNTPTLSVYNPISSESITLEFKVFDRSMRKEIASEKRIKPGVGITDWTVPVLLGDGETYLWRARAVGTTSSSPWTRPSKFIIDFDGADTTVDVRFAEYLISDETNRIEIPADEEGVARITAEFEAGTLDYDGIFTAGVVSNPPMDDSNTVIVGNVFDFGPSGLDFQQNVKLSLPYESIDLDAAGVASVEELKPLYFNPETERWEIVEILEIDEENSLITLATNHFSLFALGVADESTESAALDDEPIDYLDPVSQTSGSGGGGGGGCFIGASGRNSSSQTSPALGLIFIAALFSAMALTAAQKN